VQAEPEKSDPPLRLHLRGAEKMRYMQGKGILQAEALPGGICRRGRDEHHPALFLCVAEFALFSRRQGEDGSAGGIDKSV